MYHEFCTYNDDYYCSTSDALSSIFSALNCGVKGININSHILTKHSYLCQEGLVLSVPVDYPFGIRDSKVRQMETLLALRWGANAIDLVINPFHVYEKNFGTIKQDLQANKAICDDFNASLRPIINYNLFNSEQYVEVAQIIQDAGADFILPATAYAKDDIVDSLIVASTISKKVPGLDIIVTGKMWLKEHLDLIKSNSFFGARFYSLKLLNENKN